MTSLTALQAGEINAAIRGEDYADARDLLLIWSPGWGTTAYLPVAPGGPVWRRALAFEPDGTCAPVRRIPADAEPAGIDAAFIGDGDAIVGD